jgi:hypothetical protein
MVNDFNLQQLSGANQIADHLDDNRGDAPAPTMVTLHFLACMEKVFR